MIRQRLVATGALVAAVTAGAVGGALIGVPALSGAQGVSSTTTTLPGPHFGMHFGGGMTLGGGVFDAAAKALGLTPQQLRDKLSDGKTTIADVAKAQNVKIDDVIAAMDAVSHDHNSKIVNTPWPQPPAGVPFGPKFGPDGAPALPLRPGLAGTAFADVAKVLNLSVADLEADLMKGQSLADIAKAQKVDVNAVIKTLVDDASARIDKAVTNKRLTQAQADALKKNLQTEITNVVNNGFARFGMRGGMGHFGFRGGMGAGMGAPPAPAPGA